MTHPLLGAECQRKQLRFVRRSRQRGAGSRSAFPGERASLANSNTSGTRNAGGSAEQAKGGSGHGGRFIGFIRAIYRTYDSDLTQCNTKQHGEPRGGTWTIHKLASRAEVCTQNRWNVVLERAGFGSEAV